jgi:hypothetical protein
MQMIQNNLPSQSNKKLTFKPKPFHALGENTYELSFMLYQLHSNMLLLEKNGTSKIDSMAYTNARVYLKSAYIFYRILLDTLTAVIEYFYKKNEKISLTPSFYSLLNKQEKGQLPPELSSLIQGTLLWFPSLRSRRDDIVHNYQSFLILFQRNQKGEIFLDHTYFNSSKTPNKETLGNIRDYVGFLLKGYQELIDSLLNLFDLKFHEWYGIVRGINSRTETILEGIPGYMLWWASSYGKYYNCNMQIIEKEQ